MWSRILAFSITFYRIRINRFASPVNKQSPIQLIQHVNTFPHHIFWSPRWDTLCVDVDDEGDAPFFLVSSIIMSELTTLTSFATSALRQCPPQFQVISLITVFLSILLSTIYVIYLILYAPLERIALIALAFLLWQNQRSSSVHQLPGIYSKPSVLLNTSSEPALPALPAYTPKSPYSPCSDDSESSDDFESSDDSDVSLSTIRPSAARSNSTEPSPESPPSIGSMNVSAPSSTSSEQDVFEPIFPALSSIESFSRSSPTSEASQCRLVTVYADGTEEYYYDNPCPLTESRNLNVKLSMQRSIPRS